MFRKKSGKGSLGFSKKMKMGDFWMMEMVLKSENCCLRYEKMREFWVMKLSDFWMEEMVLKSEKLLFGI